MGPLSGKQILIGITGGIAAYKIPELIRLLSAEGAIMRVVMSANAEQFVTSMTLQAVSGHPVHTTLWDEQAEAAMGHIELARWADEVLIAPASANCIAKLANGFADDLLTTLCLATTAPISLAPAMNQQMWLNATTQENIQRLRNKAFTILGPGVGEQACGETGPGRMLDPIDITKHFLSPSVSPLTGKRVVITAGPTQEPIDPIRYITNHSSGKMGFAMAEAAKQCGADVTLITGPVSTQCSSGIQRIDVTTAQEMHQAVMAHIDTCDILVATAAVADYRIKNIASHKVKKDGCEKTLELIQNPDILADAAQQTNRPFCVGFAAETNNLIPYAQQKLQSKNADMIIANPVGASQGFLQDDNEATAIWSEGQQPFAKMPKKQLAQQLFNLISERYHGKHST